MGIYADKQFYGFRIQWLVKEIKTAFGRRVIHKANISETLLNEVVDGKWNQINVGVDSPLFSHKPFGELIHIDELFEVMNERTPEIEQKFLEKRGI